MAGDEHRDETLRALRQLCGKGTHALEPQPQSRLSLGIPSLDALLPQGGLERGSLVEWISSVEASGAAILALQGVRLALEEHLAWVVVDVAGEFHPPAACGWGVSLESLLVLRPSSMEDAVWAVEQCLRCPAVGVTWFPSRHLPGRPLPDRVVQRWKRAAEVGGGIGVLFCPIEAVRRSSWADVRWRVESKIEKGDTGNLVKVELISCRGCFAGGIVELELHDATGDVCVVSAVASATAAVSAAEV